MQLIERKAPRVSMILAATRDWAIGRNGKLLYRISEDLKHFKELTTGNVVIMGYNTYKTCVGRALPNRVNYVITHDKLESSVVVDGDVNWVSSVEDAILHATDTYPGKEIFVIGGAYVYSYCLKQDLINKIYLTCIHKDTRGEFPDDDSVLRIGEAGEPQGWQVRPIMNGWRTVSVSADFFDPVAKVGFDFREYVR